MVYLSRGGSGWSIIDEKQVEEAGAWKALSDHAVANTGFLVWARVCQGLVKVHHTAHLNNHNVIRLRWRACGTPFAYNDSLDVDTK